MLLAVELRDELQVFKFDGKKLKTPPVFVSRIRLQEETQMLMFLKDSTFGVFFPTHLVVYQVDDNNYVRQIFNKKYEVGDGLILMQVPRPTENVLNIFFREPS
jgi:hypothetical protein